MALVAVTHEGPVAVLTLDRPEARNALSIELCDAIVMSLGGIDGSDARAVIVRGNGKVFCSGADFAAVSGPEGIEFLPAFETMLEALARHRLPTVAAIHGAALGGGLQLATACDFRVCASDASIGIPSSRLGILVNFENIQRLVVLAGIAVAKEVLMTGRTYVGTEAQAAGLVTVTVPPYAVGDKAMALARDLAERAPLAVQGAKRAIQAIADHAGGARRSNPEAVEEIDRLVAQAYASEDLTEGLSALSEKRPPRFSGA